MLKSRDSLQYPDYPRIPHVIGVGSRMGADDIDGWLPYGQPFWEQEKVDGANSGVSWTDEGPLFRNRSKILRKAFDGRKDTPAKKQFTSAWNWLYEHEDDIREVIKRYQSPLTIYGEWLWAEHSLGYDKLPDWFLAYDMWDGEAQKFLSPAVVGQMLDGLNIHSIPANLIEAVQPPLVKAAIDQPSQYRDGLREGCVFKSVDSSDHVSSMFKIVRADFVRMDDEWNNRPMKRNKLKR